MDLNDALRLVADWCRRNIRWLTRPAMLTAVAIILLYRAFPPALDWVASALGLASPSLASLLSFIVLLLVLERVIVIEVAMGERGLTAFDMREDAYSHLCDVLRGRASRRVDLVQYSGTTAFELLRVVAKSSPNASVRLLLQDPNCVSCFDSDGRVNHRERIENTVERIRLLEADASGAFRVEIGYYDTPPGPSTLVVDDDLVALGLYHVYVEDGITRLRGHNAPAVIGAGCDARPLRDFVRRHFDDLWTRRKPHPQEGAGSA